MQLGRLFSKLSQLNTGTTYVSIDNYISLRRLYCGRVEFRFGGPAILPDHIIRQLSDYRSAINNAGSRKRKHEDVDSSIPPPPSAPLPPPPPPPPAFKKNPTGKRLR
jgi:hypothetical protein